MATRAAKVASQSKVQKNKAIPSKTKAKARVESEVEDDDDEDIVEIGEGDDNSGPSQLTTILKAFAAKSSAKSNSQLKAASAKIDELLKSSETQINQNIKSTKANVLHNMQTVKGSKNSRLDDITTFLETIKKQRELDEQVKKALSEQEKRLQATEQFWSDELEYLQNRPAKFKQVWKKLNKSLKAQNKEATEVAELNFNAGITVIKHLKGALKGVSSL